VITLKLLNIWCEARFTIVEISLKLLGICGALHVHHTCFLVSTPSGALTQMLSILCDDRLAAHYEV
jgi:hypothetical protein